MMEVARRPYPRTCRIAKIAAYFGYYGVVISCHLACVSPVIGYLAPCDSLVCGELISKSSAYLQVEKVARKVLGKDKLRFWSLMEQLLLMT